MSRTVAGVHGTARSAAVTPAAWPARRVRGDAGAVTVETALALPAVVLLLGLVLVTGSAAMAQLRCADAARAGARVAALGESPGAVADVARRVAGRDVEVEVAADPSWVEVSVTAAVAGSWWGGGVSVRAAATAWVEP